MKARKRFRRRKRCLGTRSYRQDIDIIMQARPASRLGKTVPLRELHARWEKLPLSDGGDPAPDSGEIVVP